MVSRSRGISSVLYLVRVVSRSRGISSVWYLVLVVSRPCCISSVWYLVLVVSRPCGISFSWYLVRVVSRSRGTALIVACRVQYSTDFILTCNCFLLPLINHISVSESEEVVGA